MTINVKKRNGSLEVFEEKKIFKVLSWASQGFDLKVNDIIQSLVLYDGITSKDINKQLINLTYQKTNIENEFNNLNWSLVAGRLKMLELYKSAQTQLNYTHFGYSDFYEFIKYMVSEGIYSDLILKGYKSAEIKKFGKKINPTYDMDYGYPVVNSYSKRYLVKNKGQIVELPQQMFMVIAMLLGMKEEKNKRVDYVISIYELLATRIISLATPFLMNLRKPNGNLSSCFIMDVEDSIEGIYGALKDAALISKNSGGLGVYMGKIRAEKSKISNTYGLSSGTISFMKLFNQTAISVNQLGSRNGAITLALDLFHYDALEFLETKKTNGDLNKKLFESYTQLIVPDLIFDIAKENGTWSMFCPKEVYDKYNLYLSDLYGDEFNVLYKKLQSDTELKMRKDINAREMITLIMKRYSETGFPYLIFRDEINRCNPNKHEGSIYSVNLCVESFSNFNSSKVKKIKYKSSDSEVEETVSKDLGYIHTCNLISFNLANFPLVDDDDFDQTIDYYIRSGVRILNSAIDLTTAPVYNAYLHNRDYRIIGLGVLGYADYVVANNIKYSKSQDFAFNLFEKFAYISIDESSNLTDRYGKYKYFEGSDWSKGIFFGKTLEDLQSNEKVKLNWNELYEKIKAKGLANGGLWAIPPNTSTSILMESTASVLPIYSKFYSEENKTGLVYTFPPKLNNDTFWLYEEYRNLNLLDVVDVISNIQYWVDQGISFEPFLNFNKITAQDILNFILKCKEAKIKTIYYSRFDTVKEANCTSCAN